MKSLLREAKVWLDSESVNQTPDRSVQNQEERSIMDKQLAEKKKFHETAENRFVPMGFKRKGDNYYRFVGEDIFQIITLHPLKGGSSDIFFDVIPLCSRWHIVHSPRVKVKELAGIMVKRYADRIEFESFLQFLIDEVDKDMEQVQTAEDCFYMRKKYADWAGYLDQEENELDPEISAFDLEWKEYVCQSYPGFQWQACDNDNLYAALQCGWYDLAREYSEYGRILRKTYNELLVKHGEISQAEADKDFCEYEEICQEEIEIVNAIQRKDYGYIDRCLKNNKKYNLEILRKIGLDINRRS